MRRTLLHLAIVISCLILVCAVGAAVWAQYQGRRVDSGQQYWNNYWQQQYQRQAPSTQQGRPATFGNTGGYYPNYGQSQKPFAGYQPAPTAYDRYWPLMVYPNTGLGYWY